MGLHLGITTSSATCGPYLLCKLWDIPVCFDATHSVQLPGGLGDKTGGQREFIPILAKAAVAVGVDCLFIESHPDPANALSDAASVLDLKDLPQLLDQLQKIYVAVR